MARRDRRHLISEVGGREGGRRGLGVLFSNPGCARSGRAQPPSALYTLPGSLKVDVYDILGTYTCAKYGKIIGAFTP